ncbi:MAG: hypothetical protein ACXWBO_20015 [Ilumatobacteraceae bacterium]
MNNPRNPLKSKILLGAVAVTAGAAMIVPTSAFAAATSTSTSPSTGDLPARYERACLRIPNFQIRTNNLITRLQGDASTKGSLAWLQAQINDAKAKNRTQLATVLQNRLAVRTQTLKVLQQRQDGLAKLLDKCRAHGVNV